MWGNKEILGTKMKGEKAAKPRWKQSYENGGTGGEIYIQEELNCCAWNNFRLTARAFFVSRCQECPVVKPTFLCGSDNRTYSSPCRLEYHNCIHHTSVRIACKGFCPCKGEDPPCVAIVFQTEIGNVI